MPFVIGDRATYAFRIDAGERVTMIDARGNRADFEVVEMVGTAGPVACVFVHKGECEDAGENLFTPPVDDLPASEFLAAGDYILLKAPSGKVCLLDDKPKAAKKKRRT
jgi:hypothetical protein